MDTITVYITGTVEELKEAIDKISELNLAYKIDVEFTYLNSDSDN